MNALKRMLALKGSGGFTLTELLVVIAVLGLVLAGLSVLQQGLQGYLGVVNQVVAVQQDGRVAVELIGRELRQACAAASADCSTTGSVVTVEYALSGSTLNRTVGGVTQPVIVGVTSLTLTYFDPAGAVTTTGRGQKSLPRGPGPSPGVTAHQRQFSPAVSVLLDRHRTFQRSAQSAATTCSGPSGSRHGAARRCLLGAGRFTGSYRSRRRREVRMATTFRRIKIQATVETAPMLLTEEQIGAALQELRDRLTRLELAIVGIEAKEEAPVELPDSLEYRD